MAKKSKIAKMKKQEQLIERYAETRAEMIAQKDYKGLATLPKEAHPNRLRHRDCLDGRPRGYMRKFGMSRIRFREEAHLGNIPGVIKSSW
ncbi:MAG: 30S ribosomal protein S14 [Vagococcus sp.]